MKYEKTNVYTKIKKRKLDPNTFIKIYYVYYYLTVPSCCSVMPLYLIYIVNMLNSN